MTSLSLPAELARASRMVELTAIDEGPWLTWDYVGEEGYLTHLRPQNYTNSTTRPAVFILDRDGGDNVQPAPSVNVVPVSGRETTAKAGPVAPLHGRRSNGVEAG